MGGCIYSATLGKVQDMRQGNEFLRLTSTNNSRKLPEFPRNDATWTEYAECTALTPEEADNLFFVPFGRTSKEAKEFCSKCPVKPECGQYALEHSELQGVWAGMSEKERQRMRSMLKIPVQETVVVATVTRISDHVATTRGNLSEFVGEVVVDDHLGSLGTNY